MALGGALGAVCRYGISLLPCKGEFPVLTLVTNLLGAVLIGFLAGLATTAKAPSTESMLFWKTGLCGGFTTFSTFALETVSLTQDGKWGIAVAYVLLSVLLSLAAVWSAEVLVK